MKKSIADIMAIRAKMQPEIILRDNQNADNEMHIIVGMGTCGIAAGAREVFNAMVDEVEAKELKGVRVTRTGSLGNLDEQPSVEVRVPGKDAKTFNNVTVEKAIEIVNDLVKA